MFDHLSLGVRNLKAAARFYDALFAPLGHSKTWEQENELAYGRGQQRLFWLYPVGGERIAGVGAHTAFRAETAAEVDEAYVAAISMARRRCARRACISTSGRIITPRSCSIRMGTRSKSSSARCTEACATRPAR